MNLRHFSKTFRRCFMAAGILSAFPVSAAVAEPTSADAPMLWFRQPAANWLEALPVGNGRLGAMAYGGIKEERIQLNEATLWTGGPYDPSNPDAVGALPEARRLIFAGQYKEAEKLMSDKMMGRPPGQMAYQPLGDLMLQFPGDETADNYRRELNLDTATASVSYSTGGVKFTRELFSSPVDQVIVLRLTADQPGKIAFSATLATPQQAELAVDGNDTLVLNGRNAAKGEIQGKLKFQARVRVMAHGGSITSHEGRVTVAGADSATLLIAAATSYRNYQDVGGDPESLTKDTMAKAAVISPADLHSRHVAEHQRLFRRVTIDLGASEAAKLPTNERVARSNPGDDPQLAALYFQYARYLMISSSRPGGQPANLQGLWNDQMNPPWDSKYTININIEMNYWIAGAGNLAECQLPLIDAVADLARTGRRTAEVNYGAKGWVCHHNFDLWRATAPIDWVRCGFWPVGGAWLCLHLWEQYRFAPDKDYLARVYPIMKGAAEFFLDTLVEDPRDKCLVTCPSTSPERSIPDGAGVCAGSTMDMGILRDLFANCIQASEILGVDADFRAQLQDSRNRLAPLKIGRHGQLQEWRDDWDTDHHDNHVSHLYNLFPSAQITPLATPELAEATKVSLRLHGDGDSSWGKAWRVNLYARLGDGEHAHRVLTSLLNDRSAPNLFSLNGGVFQIDGNLGAASGIAEMLLQSHEGTIVLLPALPDTWPNGRVTGLRARGGVEVDMEWKDGKLTTAGVRSLTGTKCRVRHGSRVLDVVLEPGQAKALGGEQFADSGAANGNANSRTQQPVEEPQ